MTRHYGGEALSPGARMTACLPYDGLTSFPKEPGVPAGAIAHLDSANGAERLRNARDRACRRPTAAPDPAPAPARGELIGERQWVSGLDDRSARPTLLPRPPTLLADLAPAPGFAIAMF
jgi:hypothetical protein